MVSFRGRNQVNYIQGAPDKGSTDSTIMANDNKEIGDIVKKCKILLLDIEGTTTSISFVKVGRKSKCRPAGVLSLHVIFSQVFA